MTNCFNDARGPYALRGPDSWRQALKSARIIFAYFCVLSVMDCSWDQSITTIPGLSLLPSKMWTIGVPFSGPMLLGYFWIWHIRKRFWTLAEQQTWNAMLALYIAWIGAIAIERSMPSQQHTPTVLSTYVYMIQFPGWAFVGYWLGAYPGVVRKLTQKMSILGAVAAFFLTAMENTVGPQALFGLNWWPFRLTILFGFCYYLFRVMCDRGRDLLISLGALGCVASQIIFPLAKPILWSATLASIAMLGLMQLAKRIRAKNVGILIVILFMTAGVVAFAGKGEFREERLEYIMKAWFHAGPEGISSDKESFLRSTAGGRIEMWEAVWPRFYRSPLLGSGFGQMSEGEMVVQLHNVYLDIILGVGLLGTIPFLGGLCLWLVSVATGTWRANCSDLLFPLASYTVGILAFGTIGNFTLFHVPGALAALCIGITLRMRIRERRPGLIGPGVESL